MNKLRIPLSAVSGRESLALDVRVDEATLRPKDAPESSLAQVSVKGTLIRVDADLLFRGSLSGTFERPCDRCLEPARELVACDVAWHFEPGAEEDAPEEPLEISDEDVPEEDIEGQRVRYFQGDELNLAPHVWEEMLLASPSKFYCSEDCKGLCPSCGVNLNEEACTYARDSEESGSGLAALKDMFPDLPSE